MKTENFRNVEEINPELNNEITQKALKNPIRNKSDFNRFFRKEVIAAGFDFSEYQNYCRKNLDNEFYL